MLYESKNIQENKEIKKATPGRTYTVPRFLKIFRGMRDYFHALPKNFVAKKIPIAKIVP